MKLMDMRFERFGKLDEHISQIMERFDEPAEEIPILIGLALTAITGLMLVITAGLFLSWSWHWLIAW